MKPLRLNLEHGLFILAFLLALAIRLFNLGQAALTDYEATWAMQSLDLFLGKHVLIGSQPGLVIWNSALFFLFGAAQLSARLLPALAGAALVFVALIFRRRLGDAALVAAFLVAVDPGLVAVSRQVDGRMFAITFGLLGLGFLDTQRPAWAGIFLGLALLGGPSIWLGGLILAAAWALNFLIARRRLAAVTEEPTLSSESSETPAARPLILAVLPWLAGSFFLAGSMFFLLPQGLSAAAASFLAFFSGISPGVSVNEVAAALPVYSPLAFLLGLAGIWRGLFRGNEIDRPLAAWLIIGWLIVILYPAHQVADMVWVIIPAIALSSHQLVGLVSFVQSRQLVALFSGAVLILLVYIWLNSIAAANPTPANDVNIYWVAILGALILILIAVGLIGWGWSFSAALQGLGLGVVALLLLITLANTPRAASLTIRPEQELWRLGNSFTEADLLSGSIGDLSEWKTGRRDDLDIQVSGLDMPALRWLLRAQQNIRYSDALAPGVNPSLVITADQKTLPLSSSYSGQDFVVQAHPVWGLLNSAEWVHWMIYRDAPLEKISIVLWVRPDVFPGAAGANSKPQP